MKSNEKKESKSNVHTVSNANELSPEAIAHAIAQLKLLVDVMKPAAASTGATNRRRGLKFRSGGEHVLPILANAVAQHGVPLPAHLSAEAMQQRMEYAQLVKPALAVAKQLTELLGDVERQAETDTWSIATTIYTVLRRIALGDPGVKSSIAEAVAFFKQPPRDPNAPRKARAKKTQPAAPAQAGETPTVAPSPAAPEPAAPAHA